MDDREIAALESHAEASVADPAPLGLWALATGTWILGFTIAAFPSAALSANTPVLLLFAGVAQFIAGLYAFRRANVLLATAFCSFGAFYAVLALFFSMAWGPADNARVIQGLVFESFAFIAAALALAAMSSNTVLFAALAGLTIGYALIGIPALANTDWNTVSSIGGWFLCAAAVASYYGGAAMVINSLRGQPVWPTGGEA
jgi:succinate-acetate transporter protein